MENLLKVRHNVLSAVGLQRHREVYPDLEVRAGSQLRKDPRPEAGLFALAGWLATFREVGRSPEYQLVVENDSDDARLPWDEE